MTLALLQPWTLLLALSWSASDLQKPGTDSAWGVVSEFDIADL